MDASDLITALKGATPDQLREIAEILFLPMQSVPVRYERHPNGGYTIIVSTIDGMARYSARFDDPLSPLPCKGEVV